MEVVYPTPKAPDSEAVLWRYMLGDYFAKMLEHFSDHDLWWKTNGQKKRYCTEPGQLWFSYPSAFEDYFEGKFPDWNRDPEKYWEHLAIVDSLTPEEVARRRSMVKPDEAEAVRTNIQSAAELTGVSCWTTKPADGEGLWALVEGNDCVAVRSTYGAIRESIKFAHCSLEQKAKPSGSHVAYIKHATYFIKHDGCRSLLALLDTAWTDESEVRIFANSPFLASLPKALKFPGLLSGAEGEPSREEIFEALIQHQLSLAGEYDRFLREKEATEGFYLPVKLNLVLHEVVMGFGCSPQFKSKIEQSLQRLGLQNTVLSERRK